MPEFRRYSLGDEERLIELWNRAYRSWGGYVTRTAAYWTWCILERPGVEPEDVLVLEDQGCIKAYGVLGPKGGVLELAVDPDDPPRRRLVLANALIEVLEQRSRARGDEAIKFQVPGLDRVLCRALKRRGYHSLPYESLQWVLVDLAGTLSKLLTHRAHEIPAGWSPNFRIAFERGYYHFAPHRTLRVEIGPPPCVDVDGAPTCDVTVSMDLSTFTELFFGMRPFRDVLARGGVRVEPASAAGDAEKLVALLSLRQPWYTPLSDER